MNRRQPQQQQICRDFQRGNCRYGASCKYLHVLPQQQQQQQRSQQQQRPQQQRVVPTAMHPQSNYEPERRDNYYGALANSGGTASGRQQQNQTQAAKEHRCNDPRACKEQIKEDFANERPNWRLTCYAHYKFLPNDVVGDVSPEELRALAYEGAKQGMPVQSIVQREASMVAAKNAEFDAFLRNPYKGPANQSFGDVRTENFGASPFSNPQPNSNSMLFGATANGSPAPPAQVFPQPSFGSTSPSPFSFGTSSGTASFSTPQQQTNLFQQSPFQGSNGPTPGMQSPFQSTFGSSPGMQSPFQSSTGPSSGVQSLFQGNTGASTGIQSPFQSIAGPSPGTQSPFLTPQAQTTQPSVFNTPTTPPQSFGTPPNSFISPSTAAPNGPAFGTQMMPIASVQDISAPKSQQSTVVGNNPEVSIWLKDTWKIGEIPEVEPPPEVR